MPRGMRGAVWRGGAARGPVTGPCVGAAAAAALPAPPRAVGTATYGGSPRAIAASHEGMIGRPPSIRMPCFTNGARAAAAAAATGGRGGGGFSAVGCSGGGGHSVYAFRPSAGGSTEIRQRRPPRRRRPRGWRWRHPRRLGGR